MRTFQTLLVLMAAALGLCGCVDTLIQTEKTLSISVSEEPTMTRVISRKSGKEMSPGINIYSDGSCVMRMFDGREITKRLRSDQVRDLLNFFEREGLFTLSDDKIQSAVTRTQLQGSKRSGFHVTDHHHVRISASTGSRNVSLHRYALDIEVEYYPTVTELQTMRNCIQKVYEVAGNTW